MSEQVTEQQTIHDFLRQHPVTMEVKRVGPTPTYDPPGQMFDFSCLIGAGEKGVDFREIAVAYHMGIGNAPRPTFATRRDRLYRWVDESGDVQPFRKWPEPKVEDVIDALRMDAQSIDNGETFIEFARESGYESLSEYEEARKCYDGCHEALKELRTLFGRAATEHLLYNVEAL